MQILHQNTYIKLTRSIGVTGCMSLSKYTKYKKIITCYKQKLHAEYTENEFC